MQRIVRLVPPFLSDEHIQEKVVCIRAHRERIFQVLIEKNAHKIICHNYGHGGAGWTFLFGCVNESVRQFELILQQCPEFRNKPICVIGAGCYGLLTAILLAQKGYLVSIVANQIDDLPSHKAAGFFFPRARKSSTLWEKEQFLQMGLESYRTYLEIAAGKHPFLDSGAKIVPAYFGLDIDPGFSAFIEQGLIAAPERVDIDFSAGKSYEAYEYQIVHIDSMRLMEQLHTACKNLGIPIIKDDIVSLEEIEEQILFNCAGLGATRFIADSRVIPVQGHLVTLKNQPIEELQYMINFKVTMQNVARTGLRDELIYFAPKGSGILGVTFIRNEGSLLANQHEFDRLLERCRDFFGSGSRYAVY